MEGAVSDNESDEALIERARGGDAQAFGVLASRYMKLLTGVAYGLLKDEGRAEDAVQDAMMSAWKSIGDYRGEARFKNWLCRIVLNKAYSALRWGRLRDWLSLDGPAGAVVAATAVDPGADADPEGSRLREERAAAIRDAVAALPLQQRTVVLLRANGMTVTEAAQTMNLAEGTVKAHLHAARARLEAALGVP